MKIASGSCPEKLIYACQSPRNEKFEWEDGEGYVDKGIMVTPAFCSDAANEATRKTAEDWATNYGCGKPVVIELDNVPRKGYRVVNFERRAQNGRVYKCVSSDGYYFDMPMDVLLDILKHDGVKDGEIMCPLVWCRIKSQMKLVRFDSELHKAVLEAQNQGKLKKITSYIPGVTYENKAGEKFIYLGNGSGKQSVLNAGSTTYMTKYIKQDVSGDVWFEYPSWAKGSTTSEILAKWKDNPSHILYYIKIMKSKKTVIREADVQIPLSWADIDKYAQKHFPTNAEYLALKVN